MPSPRTISDSNVVLTFHLGGAVICPGRFFSKAQMIFTFTCLVENFDMEVDCDYLSFNPRKDGLGAKELSNSLPFRMRRRTAQ